ncbi:DUF3108 domain-containing protein [Bacteroidota bacterium]
MSVSSQDVSFVVPDFLGETISYRLKYGIFNIGRASISCLETAQGDDCHITAEARSTGWIKIFKDLNYRFESYMDTATGLPNFAIRSLKDGRFNLYNELTFDHNSRTDSAIIFSQISGEHVVSKNIFDILTGFLHFRQNFLTGNMVVGEELIIKTFFTDELWDLKITYAGEETINTNFGEFACYVYKPVTVIGRFFKNDDDMSVWFTKSETPIPVKIQANLKFGHITCECVEYQSPK